MIVSRRMLAAVCALCMALTLMPLHTMAQTTTLPDIVVADFTAADAASWSGGNMTLVDAPEGSGVSGKLAMLETKESDNKYGTLTIGADWSDYGIDATGTDAPDSTGCGYFNMWVYSPEIKSNNRGSSAFAVMIITNTRTGDTFESTTVRRLQSGVNQDFAGWKLISIPMVDYPENGDGSPAEKFERRNLNHAPTWSSIEEIQFAVQSIGGCNVIPGNKLYFSKIWVSKEKPGGEYAGGVTSSVANNPGLLNDEFVDYNTNTITFTAEENLLDYIGNASFEVKSRNGEYTAVDKSDYSMSVSGKNVTVSFPGGLSSHRAYRVKINNIHTESYKTFSKTVEFKTIGYGNAVRNDFIDSFYDGSQTWTGGNMTTEELSIGEYDGSLGLLKSYGDTNTSGKLNFAETQNWSGAENVNLLMYSPKSVPTSKFAFLVNTKRNNGQGDTYFKATNEIAVDFAGWKVVSIPISEFTPRTSDEELADWSLVTGLSLAIKGYGSAGFSSDTEVYFKEIWISEDGTNTLKDVNLRNGEMDVPAHAMTYTQEYDSVIHNAPYAATAKLVGGGSEIEADIVISGGTVNVCPKNDLAKGTNYTLNLSGLYFENGEPLPERTISFTTTSANVYAAKPAVSEDEDGNVIVKLTVNNDTTDTVNTRIVAHLLTADGKEADVEEDDSALVPASSSIEKVLTFTDVVSSLALAGAEDILNYSVKVYAVTKADNTPIMRHVRTYPDNITQAEADIALSDANISFSAKIRDNILNVSGSCSSGTRSVFIAVLDSGTEKYSNMTETDVDGKFSVSYDIRNITTGGNSYAVSVYPYMGTKASDTFYVATTAEKNAIISGINSAQAVSDVEALLSVQTNRDALGIKSADIKNTALVLFEQKSYSSFAQIAQMAETAESVLSGVNAVKWENMAQYLVSNKDVIFGNDDFQSKFFGKSPEEQNTICSEVIKNENYPFNNFGQLRDAITGLTSGGTESGSGDTSGNNTSGGDTGYGGGFGNGGSGGGSGGTTTPKEPETETVTTPDAGKPTDGTYNDLSGYSWAKNAIEELSRKGIISGDGNGNFRPQDSVKREEFVKMLVEALDIKKDVNKNTFTDSQNGAWYESYLSAAKHSGIVQGREDGSFGIGESILRQDLAVMMLRALQAAGKAPEVAETGERFTDADKISDYAKDAVINMQSNGFVQGMGDGSFAPHESATRAQAAVIIKRILDYIGGSDTLL